MTFTILVCGGRTYDDWPKVCSTLNAVCDKRSLWDMEPASMLAMPTASKVRVVTGGAPGADSMAETWAKELVLAEYREYRPDWKQYGLRAGPIRNAEMLASEKVDLVIAFPGDKGTKDMVSRAYRAKIPVQEVK